MKLYFRETGKGHPLILLHGLWGASENWLPVARCLEDRFRVIIPDLRNHGRSPWSNTMDYDAMSRDIMELIGNLELGKTFIAGHSMGGKIAMTLFGKYPGIAEKTAVIDIAPRNYPEAAEQHLILLRFMEIIRQNSPSSREEITRRIIAQFTDEQSRQLLLKNICKQEWGYGWKINIGALRENFSSLMGWTAPMAPSSGKILFVSGDLSDHIVPQDHDLIRKYFPEATFASVPGATHWIHNEYPGQLADQLGCYFQSTGIVT